MMIDDQTVALDQVWTKLTVEDRAAIDAIIAKTKGAK